MDPRTFGGATDLRGTGLLCNSVEYAAGLTEYANTSCRAIVVTNLPAVPTFLTASQELEAHTKPSLPEIAERDCECSSCLRRQRDSSYVSFPTFGKKEMTTQNRENG